MLSDPRYIHITDIGNREARADEPHQRVALKYQLLRALYWLETSVANSHMEEVDHKNWSYIPFSHLMFLKALKKAIRRKDKNKVRFLEVGCGLGTKLWLAYWVLNIKHVCGIEINKSFANIAKEMVKHCACFGNNNYIYNENAQDFDLYETFDVIYLYAPMRSQRANNQLVEKIKEDMKVGATLLRASFGERKIVSWTKA